MKRIFFCLAALIALTFPGWAVAQDEKDDRGYLQALLEDNLSDAGRTVRITGFAGALSSQATIDELTIADAKGVWITLRGVTLDWTRSALLRGHLDINELSADEILLPRAPVSEGESVPSPEASAFALPDLPVSVNIGTIKAGKVSLGESLFGAAAVITLDGSAKLEDGAGRADLKISRIDGTKGDLTLEVSYANATRVLDMVLALSEPQNGIAANLIGLPGTPSVDMTIKGAGPLDDFAADITLATDGAPRLAGKVTLKGEGGEGEDDSESEGADGANDLHRFTADLGGDIAPLFLPEYRAFFGRDIRLKLAGARHADGRLALDDLVLNTRALRLSGALALGADNWPESFTLSGEVADAEGAPVLLPLGGVKTRIADARLDLSYDRAVDDAWRADITVSALEREDLSIGRLRLAGSGRLEAGGRASTPIGQVQGKLSYEAEGIAPDDPGLARAIGARTAGAMQFAWEEGAPLRLTDVTVEGTDYGLAGRATLQGLSDGLNLLVDGDVRLRADDLSRFADLSGQQIEGAAVLEASGSVSPLSGAFDMTATGRTRELRIAQPRIDPLLRGESRVDIAVTRNESGTRIKRFKIANDHLGAEVSGTLASARSDLTLSAEITDTALISPGLSGAATLAGDLRQTGKDWAVDLRATGPGGTRASTDAVVTLESGAVARINGTIEAAVQSLAPFSELAGRRLSGGAQMEAEGWFDPRDGGFEVTFDAGAQSPDFGVEMARTLLRGQVSLGGKVLRGPGGVITAERVAMTTSQGRALITGTVTEESTALRFEASLRDLAVIAPGVNGPASAKGTAELIGQSWRVDLEGSGPGGTGARVTGQVAADGASGDLSIDGRAPLELANAYISPNQVAGQATFDLRLNGPLALESLSGQVRTEGARAIVPEQKLRIAPIGATIDIARGRANIEGQGTLSTGGQARVAGSVVLNAPFNADLGVELQAARLSDGTIYDTTVNGRITVRGPLASGAEINADLTLGETEVSIVEAGPAIPEALSGLDHVNEPADVRRTRARAGLLEQGSAGDGGGAGAVYPIDIVLRAPSRIFVRGRGLDAELGGQLRLGGTTRDVVPRGQFDLIRGRLEILGKRLTLSEGYARLQGAFDPYLYLVATTKTKDAEIRIVLEGLASNPEITFSSNPGLPEDEIVARLLFGRDLTQISPLQAVQLAAAVQTLTGGGGGLLGNLRENFGLDDLDIRTGEDGGTEATVGKYLSDNIYTDVTVGSDGDSEINLNIEISPSVTGRGSAASDGTTSLGIFFERDY